jgi:site-specific DNA-methyltransferase (adenine-specific)
MTEDVSIIMQRWLNKVHFGDNCDLLGQLPRDCIDLVVTSPPYDDLRTYGGHSWDFYGVAWQLKRVLKPGGVIVWVVADQTKNGSETGSSFVQALHFKSLGLSLHDTMIYHKVNAMPLTHSRYDPAHEYMLVFSKGAPSTFNPLIESCTTEGMVKKRDLENKSALDSKSCSRQRNEHTKSKSHRYRKNIWPYAVGIEDESSTGNHSAIFPIKLAKDHVLSWSNQGDIVLDPFLGSGTTAVAAAQLGRQWIGFEINQEYVTLARERIARETAQLSMFNPVPYQLTSR